MTRRKLSPLILGLSLFFMLSAAATKASSPSYSPKPLEDPIRDAAENSVEFAQFNNWLNTNYDKSSPDHRQGLKEHLYSIIDSHVKQLYARVGKTYPSEKDLLLSGCFMWATRMGVFGADIVLKRLDHEQAKGLDLVASLPKSFSLSFEDEFIKLDSSLGPWSTSFPYYFMVGDVRDYETENNLRTQMVIISTGFGRHTGDKGASQSTIMLVFSPEGTPSTFDAFWLNKFGLTETDRVSETVMGFPAYKRLDSSNKLHTEVVFPKLKKGSLAVGYMGLDGTYQWNRPHFEDFLVGLRVDKKE